MNLNDTNGVKGTPLVPCPICGGEAVHAHDMLARTVIKPAAGVLVDAAQQEKENG